jgi:hypothetical protein
VTIEDLAVPDKVVQLGYPPVRIDLRDVADRRHVASGRVKASYGAVPVSFIGRNELIRNKRAPGRMKDLADVEALGEAH